MDLEAHLAAFLTTRAELAPGDRAIVAVSGGVDSVALVAALAGPAERAGVRLHVAHLDHGWRKSGAAGIVTKVAMQFGLPLTTGRLAPGWATSEDAARRARRQFLRRVAHLVGARGVFLAHHADDQAETVLMHIAQGAGVRGALGMKEESQGFWRPFLGVRKSELRAYVEAHGLPFEEDPTNDDTAHLRNFLRHDVLPAVEERLPGSPQAMVRHAGHLRSDEAHFERLLDEIFRTRSRRLPPGIELDLTPQEKADEALVSRVAMAVLEALGRRVTTGQVKALVKALMAGHGGGGRGLGVFPSGAGVYVGGYGPLPGIVAQTVAAGWVLVVGRPAPHLAAGSGFLPGAGPWTVRSWQPGDVLAGHRTKVKELLGAHRIPQPFRPRVPVVEAREGGIAAVAGLYFAATGETPVSFDPATGRLVVGVPRPVLE